MTAVGGEVLVSYFWSVDRLLGLLVVVPVSAKLGQPSVDRVADGLLTVDRSMIDGRGVKASRDPIYYSSSGWNTTTHICSFFTRQGAISVNYDPNSALEDLRLTLTDPLKTNFCNFKSPNFSSNQVVKVQF